MGSPCCGMPQHKTRCLALSFPAGGTPCSSAVFAHTYSSPRCFCSPLWAPPCGACAVSPLFSMSGPSQTSGLMLQNREEGSSVSLHQCSGGYGGHLDLNSFSFLECFFRKTHTFCIKIFLKKIADLGLGPFSEEMWLSFLRLQSRVEVWF